MPSVSLVLDGGAEAVVRGGAGAGLGVLFGARSCPSAGSCTVLGAVPTPDSSAADARSWSFAAAHAAAVDRMVAGARVVGLYARGAGDAATLARAPHAARALAALGEGAWLLAESGGRLTAAAAGGGKGAVRVEKGLAASCVLLVASVDAEATGEGGAAGDALEAAAAAWAEGAVARAAVLVGGLRAAGAGSFAQAFGGTAKGERREVRASVLLPASRATAAPAGGVASLRCRVAAAALVPPAASQAQAAAMLLDDAGRSLCARLAVLREDDDGDEGGGAMAGDAEARWTLPSRVFTPLSAGSSLPLLCDYRLAGEPLEDVAAHVAEMTGAPAAAGSFWSPEGAPGGGVARKEGAAKRPAADAPATAAAGAQAQAGGGVSPAVLAVAALAVLLAVLLKMGHT